MKETLTNLALRMVWKMEILSAVVFALIAYLLFLLWKPLNRIKKLHELGFKNEMDCIRKTKWKRRGRAPPPFPNGWYAILESRTLGRGKVKEVSILGKTLAVFRAENGAVHTVDAYCPHLGANLAYGGKVKGDCIQCPFHGWTFRGADGKCVEIPYCKGKLPEAARLHKWRCLEKNNHIYLWFHADGEEPTWSIPDLPDLAAWTYRGRTEHWASSHIEDIPENGSDMPHLHFIHRALATKGTDLDNLTLADPLTGHFFDATWHQAPAPDSHIGIMTLKHQLKLLGHLVPLSTIRNHVRQIGPGIVYMDLDMGLLGKAALVHHLLPIDTQTLIIQQEFYTSWLPTPFAKIALMVDAIQMERDLIIWNHKTYASKPFFVKEDAQILQHRRFYSQFYSEGSWKYAKSLEEDDLDW